MMALLELLLKDVLVKGLNLHFFGQPLHSLGHRT